MTPSTPKRVLCLLPAADYDPTESAVPWQRLSDAGHDVRFATPDGHVAHADPRLTDIGFSVLDPLLMTRKPDIARYRAMTASAAWRSPSAYVAVDPAHVDALLIPGGHAAGMRSMLESADAQHLVRHCFAADKPVAAVCHGVLLLARTSVAGSGRSVLHGRRTTALPATMELSAWLITAPKLGRYYRTYPQTVEAEVKAALASPRDFDAGPLLSRRDDDAHPQRGFVVRDGNYLSARWPGDCHRFAREFAAML